MNKDMSDILTPQNCDISDFIYSEHLTTLVAIFNNSMNNFWLGNYEKIDDDVVSRSSK